MRPLRAGLYLKEQQPMTTPNRKARQDMVADYVQRMGGTNIVAGLVNVVPSAVSNWVTRGSFPAYTYTKLLNQLKSPPPAYLFGMEEVKRRRKRP
jgi:hypothetical protein